MPHHIVTNGSDVFGYDVSPAPDKSKCFCSPGQVNAGAW
jgi:hypothetical protein